MPVIFIIVTGWFNDIYYISNVSDDSVLDGLFGLYPITTAYFNSLSFEGVDNSEDKLSGTPTW